MGGGKKEESASLKGRKHKALSGGDSSISAEKETLMRAKDGGGKSMWKRKGLDFLPEGSCDAGE